MLLRQLPEVLTCYDYGADETTTPTGTRTMDDQANRTAPHRVTEALDASVHDLAEGRVCDAQTVQAEARRMLADHRAMRSVASASRDLTPAQRTRSTL